MVCGDLPDKECCQAVSSQATANEPQDGETRATTMFLERLKTLWYNTLYHDITMMLWVQNALC